MERLVVIPETKFKDDFPGWGPFLGNSKPFRLRRSTEEWMLVAEEIARQNGGKLRSANWLQMNGFSGLCRVMRRRPDLFAHVEQEQPYAGRKTPEQWVPVAEEMSRKNEGKLQSDWSLRKDGFNGLVKAMKIRPDLFSHIEQEKLTRSPEEWVSVAAKMANENGGMLQSVKWLETNGFNGLLYAMRIHYDLFAYIEQERRGSRGRLIDDQGEAA